MMRQLKNNISSSPTTAAAVGLHATLGMIRINVPTYTSALFLSSYPATWIPYFFLGQVVIEIIVAFLVTPYFKKRKLKNALIFQVGAAVLMCIFAQLLSMQWFILPFIFSLFLAATNIIAYLISWNTVHDSLNILEFKQIGQTLTTAFVISKIVLGIVNLGLIYWFGIDFLPYATAVLLFISCFFIRCLKPLPVLVKPHKQKTRLIKMPLTVHLILFNITLAMCYTFTEYLLQFKLNTSFDADQIGQFMSIFIAATYLISVILGSFLVKPLVQHGMYTLLIILPLYWVVFALFVIFMPKMWSILLLAAGSYMLFFTFVGLGKQLLLNVFPSELQSKAQSVIDVIADSTGCGTASLMLILLSNYLTPSVIGIIIFILAILLLMLPRRLQAGYISTLKGEVSIKRFNLVENDVNIELYRPIIEEKISESLISPDQNLIRLGYSLLSSVKLDKLPSPVLQQLSSSFADIQTEAIKQVVAYHETTAVPQLKHLLEMKMDPEARWWTIYALGKLQPETFLSDAREWVRSSLPEERSSAISIMVRSGTADDIQLAIKSLNEMLCGPDKASRYYSSKILKDVPLEKIIHFLPDYISSSDNMVSMHAIEIAEKNNLTDLVPQVLTRLIKGGIFNEACKFVLLSGCKAVPNLMALIKEVNDTPHARVDLLIAVLAKIPGESVEQSLCELAKSESVLIKQAVAAESATRARHLKLSKRFEQEALKYALQEAELVHALRSALAEYRDKKYIFNEIAARIPLAECRYLYWLGIGTHLTSEVLGLMPAILHGRKIEQTKALELLTTLIQNVQFSELTFAMFSNQLTNKLITLWGSSESYFDAWLVKVINASATPATYSDSR